MRKKYDFSKAKRSPIPKKLKKQITIRINEKAIDYFKNLSEEIGVSYQSLINLYLVDCAQNRKRLEWNK